MVDGEIQLSGTLQSVDIGANRLEMLASSFTLPNGKSSVLPNAKPKSVRLSPDTTLFVRDDQTQTLKLTDLKAPLSLIVVGRDGAAGQPFAARTIAVWDKAENGHFSLSTRAPKAVNAAAPIAVNAPQNNAAPPTVMAPATIAADPTNQIFSSDFENLGDDNRDADWLYESRKSVQFVENDDGHYVSLNAQSDARKISRPLQIEPTWKTLKVTARVRGRDLKIGKNVWENAHIGFEFRNDKNDVTGYGFPVTLIADSDWRTLSGSAPIPVGSTRAVLDAGNFGTAGTFDIDDIRLQHDIALDALPLTEGFPEGRFETLDADGQARGWNLLGAANIAIVEENGNHFLRLTNPPPNPYLGVESPWQIAAGIKTIRISAKMRVRDLKMGKEGWETARLGLAFNTVSGEVAGNWPASLELHENTDWKTLSADLPVPPDAKFLKITPQFLNANGVMDVDDIQVEQLK